jgi:predicted metal-dependent hydrolase
MAALPQLEPYFIPTNIRAAARQVESAQLKQEIEAFVSQEARHAQQHRRWNEILGARYPELPQLKRRIKERLDASKREHSLAFRMAYTSGYEAIRSRGQRRSGDATLRANRSGRRRARRRSHRGTRRSRAAVRSR